MVKKRILFISGITIAPFILVGLAFLVYVLIIAAQPTEQELRARLEAAAFANDVPSMESMISRNPELLTNKRFSTILLNGCAFGAEVEATEVLLKHGVDPNGIELETGGTALIVCAVHCTPFAPITMQKKALKIAELLIKYGAKVDQQDEMGSTALSLCSNSDVKMVRLLVENGANPNIKGTLLNGSTGTLLDSAREFGNQPVADYLASIAKKTDTAPARD